MIHTYSIYIISYNIIIIIFFFLGEVVKMENVWTREGGGVRQKLSGSF